MVTLYSYILRELLKTFGLTLLALTVLFTLGGGLYNIVRFEGITSTDILRMLPMFVPIVLTITMPISALFASTILYGRLAADNEMTACRAAGINIHRLFLPVILLSIFVTLYSVLSANYIIPQLTQQVEYYVRSNLRNLAFGALSSKGYMRQAKGGLGQILLTADSVEAVSDKALTESGFEPPSPTRGYFWITNPRIMEVDAAGALGRFASARGALCEFDTGQPEVEVTIHLTGAEVFDMGRRSMKLGEQKIGPSKVPLPMPVKPSMVNLNSLLEWRRDASLAPDLKKQIDGYLAKLGHLAFYQYAAAALRDGNALRLTDTLGGSYEVRAGAMGSIEGGRPPILRDVRIVYETTDMTIRYDAPQATLGARASPDGKTLLEFKLEERGGERVIETHIRPGHA
ncbi:MAG: LptF/LptG family permease, partial [Phycisphaerae bacterium]